MVRLWRVQLPPPGASILAPLNMLRLSFAATVFAIDFLDVLASSASLMWARAFCDGCCFEVFRSMPSTAFCSARPAQPSGNHHQ